MRSGARVSERGELRPTKKQIEAIRLGYEKFKKQKVSLLSKVGALRYADELTRRGEHWAAGTIRALAVIENFSKKPSQKIVLKIEYML